MSQKFETTCKSCGSKNVEMELDLDYVFDDEDEHLDYTGRILITCRDCGEYDLVGG